MYGCISNGLSLAAEVCECPSMLVQKEWLKMLSNWATAMFWLLPGPTVRLYTGTAHWCEHCKASLVLELPMVLRAPCMWQTRECFPQARWKLVMWKTPRSRFQEWSEMVLWGKSRTLMISKDFSNLIKSVILCSQFWNSVHDILVYGSDHISVCNSVQKSQ